MVFGWPFRPDLCLLDWHRSASAACGMSNLYFGRPRLAIANPPCAIRQLATQSGHMHRASASARQAPARQRTSARCQSPARDRAALGGNARMIGILNLIARFALPALLGAALAGGAPPLASAAETISEQDAHAIGVATYLYFYSLVTMDLTRKQLTNIAKVEGIHAPMNTFANIPTFPPADMKVVVRPNFDTLYSSAWLDMTKEPMIVTVPDTHG